MIETRGQGLVLLALTVLLAAFLVGHSLVVEVDYDACFGNFVASINGERPYLRVEEMSLAQLIREGRARLSWDHWLIAALGLLPLSPFVIAWLAATTRQTRLFWTISASVSLTIIVARTSMQSLLNFYDCELNGLSLVILFAPIAYTVLNAVAILPLALLHFLVRTFGPFD